MRGQHAAIAAGATTVSFPASTFTNNTYRVTEAFDINLGLRYTYDSKRLLGVQDNLGTNGAACGGALANQNPANRLPGTVATHH